MLDAVRADSAPPLAYLIEHVFTALWPGPAGLRLLPALAGAATIPLGAALGRRIAGDRAGVMSAAVCACAPQLALTSLDARMYALAGALVMASTLALWRAAERPTAGRWVLYAVVTVLALHTAYFAALAIPAQLVALRFVLHARRRDVLVAAAAAGGAVASLVPWLLASSAQLSHTGQAFWIPPLGFASVTGALVQFFLGPPVQPWVPLRALVQTLQGLAVAAGLVMAAVLIARRGTLTPGGRRTALFCGVCGIGAVLVLGAVSVWRPVFDGRYAGVGWAPLFALLGAGLAMVGVRRVLWSCVAVTAGSSLALALAATHPQTQAAIASLDARLTSRDLVDAHPSLYLLLRYYAPASLLSRTLVVEPQVDWFWGTAAYPPGATSASVPAGVVAAGGAIYYVRQPDDPPPVALPPGYGARSTQCWTGVCVVTYTRAG